MQPVGAARDRIIAQQQEIARQDRPGFLTNLLDRIPGIRRVLEADRPALKMKGDDEKVLVAMGAERAARAAVATQAFGSRQQVLDQLKAAFGKDVLRGKAKLTSYDLTPEQRAALDGMVAHNDAILATATQGYGADIGRYTIPPSAPDPNSPIYGTLLDVAQRNGYFLPNSDVSEDVVAMLGSEQRTVATGRGKARVWPTAADRMASDKTFKPELDVQRLIEGMDSFKASAAGGMTYRKVIGGMNRLEVMQETHPALAEKMLALRRRVGNLQGMVRDLNAEAGDAIADFMASPVEDADLTALQAALDPAVVPGRYVAKASPFVGMKTAQLRAEIAKTKADIAALKPAWQSANLKPYVFVQNGLYRYFPGEQAKLIQDSLKTTNNPLLNFLENWRGQAFSGDTSPLSIQDFIGILADPPGSMRAFAGAIKKSAQTGNWGRVFSASALAEDVRNDPDWARFASLTGRGVHGTPEEYQAGYFGRIPGFNAANEALYTTVTRAQFDAWKRATRSLVSEGFSQTEAEVAAAAIEAEVFPLVNPARLGQSQARAAVLRAIPTSYSFIRQPAVLMYDAARAYGKLAARQTLTPRERLSAKIMTTMAVSALILSATSAAINAAIRNEDVLEAIKDAVNPDPNNGKFLSIIIGDMRIPLGAPYRALFRAIYPQEVKGVPFPVPFAGLGTYLGNRIGPAIRTQIDLIRNTDYYGNTIRKGSPVEQLLRGLAYEIEGAAPLSIGAAIEGVRTGAKPEETMRQVIGQFAGQNVMQAQTPYSVRSEAQDKAAQANFGVSWDDLAESEQYTLRKANPAIAEAEAKIATERAEQGARGYQTPQEQVDAANNVLSKLDKEKRATMAQLGVTMGAIPRTLSVNGESWWLNDYRYERYQKRIAYEIGVGAAEIKPAQWAKETDSGKAKWLEDILSKARSRAREFIIDEAESAADKRNKQRAAPTAPQQPPWAGVLQEVGR